MADINYITSRIEEAYYTPEISIEDLKTGVERQRKGLQEFKEDLEHFHGMEEFSVGKRELLFSVSWDFGFEKGELLGVYSTYSVISQILRVA